MGLLSYLSSVYPIPDAHHGANGTSMLAFSFEPLKRTWPVVLASNDFSRQPMDMVLTTLLAIEVGLP